jgi:RhtB (resistance to homoserine/threonine) family protein
VWDLYWQEFITIAVVHLLGVASPGPDFAIVLKHSVKYGRRAAIMTSMGVGVGILLHVAYSLVGIGLLIQTTPWLLNSITLLAASYLVYLGVQGLRASASPIDSLTHPEAIASISDRRAWLTGFLTNGLNPKATLFFLSVFAVVISVHTPVVMKLIYGIYLALATAAWFCMLSWLFSSSNVTNLFNKQGHWFDRIMGLVLVSLALKLMVEWL